jgi:hypothetical protein
MDITFREEVTNRLGGFCTDREFDVIQAETSWDKAQESIRVIGACPETVRSSINKLVEHGIMPGGFVSRVIGGDLWGAYRRADMVNRANFGNIVAYVELMLPWDVRSFMALESYCAGRNHKAKGEEV